MVNIESINIDQYKTQLRSQLDLYEVGYKVKETVVSLVQIAPMIMYYDVRIAAASLFLISEVFLAPSTELSRQTIINDKLISVLDILRQELYFGNSINQKAIRPKRYDAQPTIDHIEDSSMTASVMSLYFNLERKQDKAEISIVES